VRKAYPNTRHHLKTRHWKLKELEKEEAESTTHKSSTDDRARDYELFLQELEEDPELRSQINLYKGLHSFNIYIIAYTSYNLHCCVSPFYNVFSQHIHSTQETHCFPSNFHFNINEITELIQNESYNIFNIEKNFVD
jgi:hypothetical protein